MHSTFSKKNTLLELWKRVSVCKKAPLSVNSETDHVTLETEAQNLKSYHQVQFTHNYAAIQLFIWTPMLTLSFVVKTLSSETGACSLVRL